MKKGIVALLACVFALSLALVGCSGGTNSEQAAKDAFKGTWDLVEMSQGDQVTGSDELNTLKSLGLEVYVNLNEDGTAALVLFGEVLDGTWKANSTTEGTITMEGQDVSMSIADSKLTFEQEGAKLTFQKGEPKETPAKSESASSSSSATESSSASASASSAEAASASAEAASASASAASPEAASASASASSAEAASASAASAEAAPAASESASASAASPAAAPAESASSSSSSSSSAQ